MSVSAKIRLVQTLILNDLDEVLLVKWTDGPNKDRYTACLGDVGDDESDEKSAVAVVQELVGLELQPGRCETSQLSLCWLEKVAEFEFVEDDGEECDEIEFIYRASRKEATNRRRDTGVIGKWFKVDDIPYSLMPADDELWYPLVLRNDRVLSGRFSFLEDRLLDFEVRDAQSGSVVCSKN
eukprot:2022730-Pyramimonas_sp.AAC.1